MSLRIYIHIFTPRASDVRTEGGEEQEGGSSSSSRQPRSRRRSHCLWSPCMRAPWRVSLFSLFSFSLVRRRQSGTRATNAQRRRTLLTTPAESRRRKRRREWTDRQTDGLRRRSDDWQDEKERENERRRKKAKQLWTADRTSHTQSQSVENGACERRIDALSSEKKRVWKIHFNPKETDEQQV